MFCMYTYVYILCVFFLMPFFRYIFLNLIRLSQILLVQLFANFSKYIPIVMEFCRIIVKRKCCGAIYISFIDKQKIQLHHNIYGNIFSYKF